MNKQKRSAFILPLKAESEPAKLSEKKKWRTYKSWDEKTAAFLKIRAREKFKPSAKAVRAAYRKTGNEKTLTITPKLEENIQCMYMVGMSHADVAAYLFLPKDVYCDFVKARPDFEAWIEQAKTFAMLFLKKELYKSAVGKNGKPPHIQSMWRWLYHFGGLRPIKWEKFKFGRKPQALPPEHDPEIAAPPMGIKETWEKFTNAYKAEKKAAKAAALKKKRGSPSRQKPNPSGGRPLR